MKRILVLFMMLLPLTAWSQTVKHDVLILNDGRQVHGTITEQNDSYVKLKTSADNERIYYRNDIKDLRIGVFEVPLDPQALRINKKERQDSVIAIKRFNRPKGFFANMAVSGILAFNNDSGNALSAHGIVGYRFSPYFAIGSGVYIYYHPANNSRTEHRDDYYEYGYKHKYGYYGYYYEKYEEYKYHDTEYSTSPVAFSFPLYLRCDIPTRGKVSPFIAATAQLTIEKDKVKTTYVSLTYPYPANVNVTTGNRTLIEGIFDLTVGVGFNIGKSNRMDVGLFAGYNLTYIRKGAIMGLNVGFSF